MKHLFYWLAALNALCIVLNIVIGPWELADGNLYGLFNLLLIPVSGLAAYACYEAAEW